MAAYNIRVSRERENGYWDQVLYGGRTNTIWHIDKNGVPSLAELKPGSFVSNPVFVVLYHDGAGRVWDRAHRYGVIPSNSTLVHVDAHDDLALPPTLPQTIDELSTQEYGVGSFILPRVKVGMIGRIVWVKPQTVESPGEEAGNQNMTLQTIHFPESIESPLLPSKPKVTVTEDVPLIKADLLDIDLDFFTAGLPEWFPNFFLKKKVTVFITSLVRKIQGIKIITIAVSPGYTHSSRERVLLESTMKALSRRSS
ncbi:MAG: UPF0489 family protein [Candidatus Levybacteria bacterium]|nr:UPF0489 family protein [Candidatus Levybacteria bacterium]